MELKQVSLNKSQQSVNAFNRTFMELKLRMWVSFVASFLLLIAPLWN